MSASSVTVERDRAGWGGRVADYVELSKPRILTLVLISVSVSYWMATWGRPDMRVLAGVLAGTLLVAASASAMNQLIEWRRDAVMERTANRPLPASRLRKREAWIFASLALIAGIATIYFTAGVESLVWACLTWLLYVLVYTPSKVRTPWNTLVGAVPGAMPVLIGWAASGSPYDIRVIGLYAVLFLWQFPHFMAIAWMYRHQYDRAGMRMLSVVDPTGRRAGFHAMLAAALLVPVSLLPALAMSPLSGGIYAGIALAMSLGQLAFAMAFRARLTDRAARYLLRCTLLYLPLLLVLMVVFPWTTS